METNEAEKESGNIRYRGDRRESESEREREREMGWDVRLFATRTEQFLAELLISNAEGRKMRKVKCFCGTSKEEAQTEFVLLDIPL